MSRSFGLLFCAALSACASRVTVFVADGGPSDAAPAADAPTPPADTAPLVPGACAPRTWCWQNPLPRAYGLTVLSVAPNGSAGWALGRGGTALRYDGTRWVEEHAPTTRDFDDLWVDPSGYPWATASGVEGGERVTSLWRWGAGGWVVAGPTGRTTYTVHGSAANDVWTTAYMTPDDSAPWHWDGTQWTRTMLPDGADPIRICAHSRTEAWATARTFGGLQQHAIYHWDGTRWLEYLRAPESESFEGGLACPREGELFLRVNNTSAGHARVGRLDASGDAVIALPTGATYVTSLRQSAGGAVLLGTGGRFHELARSAGAWTAILVDGEHSGYPIIDADLAAGSTQGWLLTDRGALLRWVPNTTSPTVTGVTSGSSSGTLAHLRGLAGLGEAPEWAVGEGMLGTRRANGAWTFAPPAGVPGPYDLRAVATDEEGAGWAVGAGGLVVRLTRGAAGVAQRVGTEGLTAVALESSRVAWAAGSAGTVLRYDGTQWAAAPGALPTTVLGEPLAAFTATGIGAVPSTVWVVGTVLRFGEIPTPAALVFNGTTWRVQELGEESSGPLSVWFVNSSDVWIAGARVRELRVTGLTEPYPELRDVRAMTKTLTGSLHFLQGDTVRYVDPDTNALASLAPFPRGFENPNALWVGPTNEVWVAGNNGAILRWVP